MGKLEVARMKKALTIFIIYALWFVIDITIHGNLLMESYEATSQLWRPEQDMRVWAMSLSNVIKASCFLLIYSCLVTQKSTGRALGYGALMGVLYGAGMGLGTWSYMPVTPYIAQVWVMTEFARYVLSGAVLGVMLRD